jgi:CDP-diacylglycerol--glycerol-3-phosphate 3-phosphatidyltransferase
MPSVYQFKPRFQAFLRPLVTRLAARGVCANHVTIAAVVLSLLYGAAIAITGGASMLLIGLPAVLAVRMALNAIDGMLAREFGQKSDLGFVLNELGDAVADAALYLPLALISGVSASLVALVVVAAVLVEFTGLLSTGLGQTRNYAGPFGKSDRAVFFGALAFALGAGAVPGVWLTVALAGGLALSVLTIINRAKAPLTV